MDRENNENRENEANATAGNSESHDQMSAQNSDDQPHPDPLNGLQAESQSLYHSMENHLESDEFHDAAENVEIAGGPAPASANGILPLEAPPPDAQHEVPEELPIEAIVQPPRVAPAPEIPDEVVEPLFVEVLQPPPPEPNPAHRHHHVVRLARALRMRWRRFADYRFGWRRRNAPAEQMDVDAEQPAPGGVQAIVNEDSADEDTSDDDEPLVGASSSSDEEHEAAGEGGGALQEELLRLVRRHRERLDRQPAGNAAPVDADAEPNVGDELLAFIEKRERRERAMRRERRKLGASNRQAATARDFDVTLPGTHSVQYST